MRIQLAVQVQQWFLHQALGNDRRNPVTSLGSQHVNRLVVCGSSSFPGHADGATPVEGRRLVGGVLAVWTSYVGRCRS